MIGRTFSHYKIVRQLGAGGMGEVYLAEDLELARKVALKFLSSSWAREPEALERFATEARAAAGLSHPNIATIYNVEQAEGQRFLVLEFLEGETLAARIGRGPLPVDEVMRIAKALAGALAHAHENGIVHRDIKSANIMITPGDVPKILDFGLALRREETRVTRAGSTVGTANYMSPEQARGKNADARSDIWSLGVVLYEALTGRLPFTAESLEATVNLILTATPTPPTALRTGISLDLERVVLRCIEKDAGLRYQHADDLLSDLRGIESRESRITTAAADTMPSMAAAGPASASAVPVGTSARQPAGAAPAVAGAQRAAGAQGRKNLMIGVGIVAAFAVAATSYFMMRGGGGAADSSSASVAGGTEKPAPSIAVVDFRNLSDPADNAPGTILTSLVQVGLIEMSPCRVVSNDYLQDLRRRLFGDPQGPIGQDQALQLAREGGTSTVLLGDVARDASNYFITWRLVNAETGEAIGAKRVMGANYAELADSAVAGVLPLLTAACQVEMPDHIASVTAMTTENQEAFALYVSGRKARDEFRLADAERDLKRAIALDPVFALAQYELALVFVGQNLFTEAIQSSERAWEHRQRLGIRDMLRLEALRAQLRFKEKEREAIYQDIYARWPDDLDALGAMTRMHSANGEFAQALALSTKRLELYPDNRQAGTERVYMLLANQRLDDALREVRAHARKFPDNPNAWDTMADVFRRRAEPDSAEAAYRKALEVAPEFWSAHRGIAACAYMRGDLNGAIRLYENLLTRSTDPNWPIQQEVWQLGGYYHDAGRDREALSIFERFPGMPEPINTLIAIYRAETIARAGRPLDALQILSVIRPRAQQNEAVQRDWLSARGEALIQADSLAAARQVEVELRGLIAKESPRSSKRLSHRELEARIALAEGRPAGAVKAVESIMSMSANPYGSAETGELLAKAYRAQKKLDAAVRMLTDFQKYRRGWARYHYLVGQIREDQGRKADAAKEYERFLDFWKKADANRPELADARARLNALRQGRVS